MATYKGQDISTPDFVDQLLRLYGNRAIEQPNVEEDLGAWPEATQDYVPRPGQKNYLANQHMAGDVIGPGAMWRMGVPRGTDFSRNADEIERLKRLQGVPIPLNGNSNVVPFPINALAPR